MSRNKKQITLRITAVLVNLVMAITSAVGQGVPDNSSCKIVVGQNVQVGDGKKFLMEPWISVSPTDPKNLLVTAQSADPRNGYYFYTKDGGNTWNAPSPTMLAEDRKPRPFSAADNTNVFSKSGTAFYFAMGKVGVSATSPAGTIMIYRSTDGGKTTAQQIFPFLHFPRPASDQSDGKYSGYLYLFGQNTDKANDRMDLMRSVDDGRSWTARFILGPKEMGFTATSDLEIGVTSADVTRSGKLVTVTFVAEVASRDVPKTFIVSSVDGGETFSSPIQMKKPNGDSLAGMLLRKMSFAIDKSDGPFRDNFYTTWVEKLSDGKRNRLMFSTSKDGGRTWEEPINLKSDLHNGELISDFLEASTFPEVQVNKDGVVLVSVYRAEAGPWSTGSPGRRVRTRKMQRVASASLDGGRTFLAASPIANVPTVFKTSDSSGTERWLDFESREIATPSDYLNVAAGPDGTFHAAWMDGRTGLQQIWYAPISVQCGGIPAKAILTK